MARGLLVWRGRRRVPVATVVWLAVAGVGLIGCSPGEPLPSATPVATSTPAPPTPEARWHVVDDPSFGRAGPGGGVSRFDIVVMDGQPAVLASGWQRAAGDAPTMGRLLRGGTEGEWTAESLPGGDEAGTSVGGAAMLGDTPLVVGNVTAGGRITPRLWRHHDGAWQSMPTGDGGGRDDRSFGSVAAAGDGGAMVLTFGRRGDQHEVGVTRIDSSGAFAFTRLPGSDDRTGVAFLTTHDHRAVIIGDQTTSTGTTLRAWHSQDDGRTWVEASPGSLGPEGSSALAALVWSGDQFFAFGTDSAGTTMEWASTDGATWSANPLTVDGRGLDVRPRFASADDATVVLTAVERTSWTPLQLRRSATGGWTRMVHPKSDFRAVSTGAGPVVLFAGRTMIATNDSTGTTIATAQGSGWKVADTPSPATIRWPESVSLTSVSANGANVVIGGTTGPYRIHTNGWTYGPLLWAGPLADLRSQPSLADDLNTMRMVTTAPDGRIVVLGLGDPPPRPADADPATTDFNGWVGTVSDDNALEKRSAIGGDGEQLPNGIDVRTDGAWAFGSTRANYADSAERPAIWWSPDLGSWTEQPIDSPRGDVTGVCTSGVNTFAVGEVFDDADLAHPSIWQRNADGAWIAVDAESGRGATGWLSSCVAQGSSIVVIGTIDQQPVVYTVDVEGSLHPATIAIDRRVYPRSVRATPDGFLAVGTDASGAANRPALWTSKDGSTWTRRPVPDEVVDHDGVSVTDVAVTETHAYLLVSEANRNRMWVFDDVPALFA